MTDNFTHPNDAPEGHRWTLRGGWEWHLLEVGTDGLIYGAYKRNGRWYMSTHFDDGTSSRAVRTEDLIDAPREHTVWVHQWRRPESEDAILIFTDEEAARRDLAEPGSLTLIACKQITITEGEGL